MRIRLQSGRKLELVKKVQEREKEGWECVAPISTKKAFQRDFDTFGGKNYFKGTYEYCGTLIDGEEPGYPRYCEDCEDEL